MNPSQRWRDRRDSYRPAGETINTLEYEVASIAEDNPVKAFVRAHHYSGCYPAARWRFGLYRRAELVGVAVFSQPMSKAVLRDFPGEAQQSVELGRFVLLDDVPANGETWFLGRAFDHLRKDGVVGVVSFSDDVPRTTGDGRQVFAGHIGNIYQAHNGIYRGRATARTLQLLPNGLMLSDRAQSKIRKRERGWRYSSEQLVAHGAAPLDECEDAAEWLARWKAALCRPLRHPGNHKYIWAVDKHARKHVQALPSQKYPKYAIGEAR
jgi:hypothetical protein